MNMMWTKCSETGAHSSKDKEHVTPYTSNVSDKFKHGRLIVLIVYSL